MKIGSARYMHAKVYGVGVYTYERWRCANSRVDAEIQAILGDEVIFREPYA